MEASERFKMSPVTRQGMGMHGFKALTVIIEQAKANGQMVIISDPRGDFNVPGLLDAVKKYNERKKGCLS